MVDAVLEEVIGLRTEPSPSERVIRIATQSDRATILHRHDPRASVRAFVRARTANSRERLRRSHERASLGRTGLPRCGECRTSMPRQQAGRVVYGSDLWGDSAHGTSKEVGPGSVSPRDPTVGQ
jgi:hypothetical protein